MERRTDSIKQKLLYTQVILVT